MEMTITHSSESIYEAIDRLVAAQTQELIALRHHLHRNPELSNREVKTSAFVAEQLNKLGLDEVRTGIAGHGVVGVLRGGAAGDRVIALRADMDALPIRETSGVDFASTVVDETYPGGPFPVAHACGHDCHVATVLTTAKVLSSLRDRLPGTALFVFQPAEEGAPVDEQGGARAMMQAGALADPEPSMVFGMHVGPLPKGVVGYKVGNFFAASCLIKIVVNGIGVHASTPWMGMDPMPAAAAIITGSAQLYRQVPAYDPVTVTFGHIQDHGRFNTIGDTVTLWGTIRCSVDMDMAKIQNQLRTLAQHTAEAYGCSATVDYLQDVPAVHNTRVWVDKTLSTLRRAIGDERIVEIPGTLGYDDVSEFVNTFGGVYLSYGVQDTLISNGQVVPIEGGRGVAAAHNSGFYADDEALVDSVRIHAYVAVDHLTGVLNSGSD
jgi:amidohydrolase